MWHGGALGLAAVRDAALAFSEVHRLNTLYSYFFWALESREEEEHAGHRSPALWNGVVLLSRQCCAHLLESAASLSREKKWMIENYEQMVQNIHGIKPADSK